jgi:hypothetical protein
MRAGLAPSRLACRIFPGQRNGWAEKVASVALRPVEAGIDGQASARTDCADRPGLDHGLAPDPSSLAVDRNPLHLPLSCRQFRQRDGEHTVLERRGDFFLVDVIDRNAPLETSVVAFAE